MAITDFLAADYQSCCFDVWVTASGAFAVVSRATATTLVYLFEYQSLPLAHVEECRRHCPAAPSPRRQRRCRVTMAPPPSASIDDAPGPRLMAGRIIACRRQCSRHDGGAPAGQAGHELAARAAHSRDISSTAPSVRAHAASPAAPDATARPLVTRRARRRSAGRDTPSGAAPTARGASAPFSAPPAAGARPRCAAARHFSSPARATGQQARDDARGARAPGAAATARLDTMPRRPVMSSSFVICRCRRRIGSCGADKPPLRYSYGHHTSTFTLGHTD